MQHEHSISWSHGCISTTRQLITADEFCHQHRAHDKAYTRKRHFTFMNSIVFLLQKTVRSVQLHIQSFFAALGEVNGGPTSSAWSQARLKLRHTAFIELNERAVVQVVYRDPHCPALQLWKGHRLVAIDSSLVRLPAEPRLGREFGWVASANQQGGCGRYPQARLSVLTDVLNRMALQTFFEPWQTGERELAQRHLERLEAWDLVLMDRGFAEYGLWARLLHAQRGFLCRCQANSFAIVNRLFRENQAGRSVVVELKAGPRQLPELRAAGLPEVIRLRFITLRLSTGELEVLATNLLDEARYPTDCFGALYHCRWGIETFYGLVKGRLDLGNFTGLSPEAVRQDVYATMFVSNVESILIASTNDRLQQRSAALKHRQQVNHAVSFHAIKTQMISLLVSQEPIPQVLQQLEQLFLATPTTVRPGRSVPRKKPSAWRSYYHQRNRRKIVF